MQFCSSCGNMYYLKLTQEGSDSLAYYCRKCGDEVNVVTQDNMCVSQIDLTHQGNDFSHMINKHTKLCYLRRLNIYGPKPYPSHATVNFSSNSRKK